MLAFIIGNAGFLQSYSCSKRRNVDYPKKVGQQLWNNGKTSDTL